MAERAGFEPAVHLLGAHTISSRAPSASRAPLRVAYIILYQSKTGKYTYILLVTPSVMGLIIRINKGKII